MTAIESTPTETAIERYYYHRDGGASRDVAQARAIRDALPIDGAWDYGDEEDVYETLRELMEANL